MLLDALKVEKSDVKERIYSVQPTVQLLDFNMAEVHALDDYYLAITLLITIAYQLFFFSIAFSLKFDKLTGTGPHKEVAVILLTLFRLRWRY